MLISTYFKENAQSARAEVLINPDGGYYYAQFYDNAGNMFKREAYLGKTREQVEAIAEDWAQGYNVLNG